MNQAYQIYYDNLMQRQNTFHKSLWTGETPSKPVEPLTWNPGLAIDTIYSCCGVCLLHNFRIPYGDVQTNIFNETLGKRIASAKLDNYGSMIAQINNHQFSVIGPLLDKAGFKLLYEHTNPVHQNRTTIYHYIKDLTK